MKVVYVIKAHENNPGIRIAALEKIFGCGRTQISRILKSKNYIRSLYLTNVPGSQVTTLVKLSVYQNILKFMDFPTQANILDKSINLITVVKYSDILMTLTQLTKRVSIYFIGVNALNVSLVLCCYNYHFQVVLNTLEKLLRLFILTTYENYFLEQR